MSRRELPPHWRDRRPVAFEEAGIGGMALFCVCGLILWALILWAVWRWI